MLTGKKLFAAACISAVVVSSGAYAQDGFYYGIGLGYSSADSNEGIAGGASGTSISSAEFAALGLTLGYSRDRGNMFFGGELDADISAGTFDFMGIDCSFGAAGPYYCATDATVRLRAIVGTDLNGDYQVFGAAGFAAVSGTSATGPGITSNAVNTGYTVALGVQRRLNNGAMARVEVNYDDLSNAATNGGNFEPDYKSVGLKFTYLFAR